VTETAAATDDLLVATDVRKEFGGLVAVNNVSFTVPRGKVISLIGPNGAGKTTFFNMLTGVYKPTGGTITFLGEDVTGRPPHVITSRGVGRTFWTTPGSAESATSSRRTCRTATSGSSRWHVRSRPSRSCCCSTSRPPA
jgi:ABC-type branched-subunit amino acid transport system ATPase component